MPRSKLEVVVEVDMELKLKIVTTKSNHGWVGGWTKTKLMRILTQVEVVV